jgi:hypothetical protein
MGLHHNAICIHVRGACVRSEDASSPLCSEMTSPSKLTSYHFVHISASVTFYGYRM